LGALILYSEGDSVPASGNKRRTQRRKMLRSVKGGNRKKERPEWRQLKPDRPTIGGILELLSLIGDLF
jgi:hypothetical protein